jgi:hypothetical protein
MAVSSSLAADLPSPRIPNLSWPQSRRPRKPVFCVSVATGTHLEHLQTAPWRLLLAAAPSKRLARRAKSLYAAYSDYGKRPCRSAHDWHDLPIKSI